MTFFIGVFCGAVAVFAFYSLLKSTKAQVTEDLNRGEIMGMKTRIYATNTRIEMVRDELRQKLSEHVSLLNNRIKP